jgi:alkaline phosphatase D
MPILLGFYLGFMADLQNCCFLRPVNATRSFLALAVCAGTRLLAQQPFAYGVASGDPYSESVVLWTALEGISGPETITWECSRDADFTSIYTSGSVQTDPAHSGTAKVVARGLEAGTTYFYRFWWNEHVSTIGQTKTAPAPNALEPVKLAVVSCAHYEAGYFYGYGEIAQRSDVDVVVHLGDYIYEYGPWKAGWKVPGRVHVPDHEIVSLNDYRTRYAQYHRDPNLQAMHAAHPVIAIWDDHEIANNSFATGADNHQENEGDYAARRQAAMQAYYEWMPVREEDPQGYRAFRYGQMLDLILLETRLDGRTDVPRSEEGRHAPLEEHHLMSEAQRTWVTERLQNSAAAYRVLGNQTIFSPLDLGVLPTKRVKDHNPDAWDGYLAERDHLANLFPTVAPVVILTGDSHCSWGFEGPSYVELCTPSITSTNFDEYANPLVARFAGFLLWMRNKNLEYVNVRDHGFLTVEFTQESAQAEWIYVKNIKSDEPWRVSHRRRRSVHPWTKNLLTKAR